MLTQCKVLMKMKSKNSILENRIVFVTVSRQYIKGRAHFRPEPFLFFAKKRNGHFSPSSDGIFTWDFFKTTSTHRELSIPRVFDDMRISDPIMTGPSSWRLASKRGNFANLYQTTRFEGTKSPLNSPPFHTITTPKSCQFNCIDKTRNHLV